MTDMSASVVLKFVDDVSGPSKRAGSYIKNLIKDVEKLNKLTTKSKGGNRQMEGLVKEMKRATEASKKLRQSMARPPVAGYAKAARSIGTVTSAAEKAATAVRKMNSALKSGGGLRGGGSGTSGGGRGGSGGGHGRGGHGFFRGAAGHIGSAAHMFGHAIAFQATEGMIHGVVESMKAGMEQAFDRQHTVAMLKMQGETQKEIDAAVAQSRAMAKSLPTFTSAQHLEAIAELRPALIGGLSEATKLAPLLQRSVGVLEAVKQGAGKHALGGVDTHGEALDLMRALEIGGYTTHKGWSQDKIENNMTKMVDGMTKAIVGMNGQISAKDFHSAFKFSRGDSVNWTPEFATQILPTLMNELKKSSKTDASQTGNALKSMSRVIMDGVMGKDVAAKWGALDMFAPGAMTKGKGGLKKNPKFNGGVMLGADVWQGSPFEWMQQFLLPHLQSHGVDLGNRKAVVAALGGLFGNRVANHIAQILSIQQDQIRKDQDNIKKAQGTGGYQWMVDHDSTARMQVLAASFKELAGALGDIALPGTIRGMKGLIDWAHRMSETIGKSSYVQGLKGHFEAAIAGLFGQGMGRRGFSKGRDKDYFQAAGSMSDGWSKWMASVGRLSRFFEEIGVVSGSMKALGATMRVFAVIVDAITAGCSKLKDALNSDFVKTGIEGLGMAIDGIKSAFAGMVSWLREKFSFMFPSEAKASAKPAVEARDAAKALMPPSALVGLRANRPPPFGGLSNTFSPKGAFGLGGVQNVGSQAMQPIISAAQSSTPAFTQAGVQGMASLAAGLQSGSGQAVGAMSSLMSNLAAIAAAGVTVPVKLDTSGAEGQLSSLMARAGKIGTAGGRFSPALHDTGQ